MFNSNNNLLIVTNIFIFCEQVAVLKDLSNSCFTINPNYVKDNITKCKLIQNINVLYPSLRYVEFSEILKYQWGNVLCSSYLANGTYEVVKELKYSVLSFVEDGSYDYFTENIEYTDFLKDKDLYIFKPKESAAAKYYKSVQKITLPQEIQRKLLHLYSKDLSIICKLPKDTPVLFTSPLAGDFDMSGAEEDILRYVEDNFKGKTVIVKKHPRDLVCYKSDKINIVECNKELPGQILDLLFDGPKLFMFPSTICFMSGKAKDMVVYKLKSEHKGYNDFFRKAEEKGILKVVNL